MAVVSLFFYIFEQFFCPIGQFSKTKNDAKAPKQQFCIYAHFARWPFGSAKHFYRARAKSDMSQRGQKNWLWRWWWLSPVTFLHCCDTVGGSVALEDIINLTRLLHWACKIIFVYIFSHSRCFRFKKLKSVLHQNCYSRIKPWHNPGSSYPWKSRRPLSGAEDDTNSHQ